MMKKKIELFDIVNNTVLILVAIVCIYPFINILAVSVSNGTFATAGEIYLLPKGFNLQAYKFILTNGRLGITTGIINSVLYTVVGTILAVFVTFLTAYSLSRKRLKGRNAIMLLFIISWIFEAGIIPNYIINHALGLVNNPLVMIIPGAISTFLLIINRTFLEGLPDELEEAAIIDGANDFQMLWKIFFPLAKPVIATISLFYAVQIWNAFLVPLIYLQDVNIQPLQLILYNFVLHADKQGPALENIVVNGFTLSPKNLQAAVIFISMFPILVAYPFAQKYFTKGLLIGAVKG